MPPRSANGIHARPRNRFPSRVLMKAIASVCKGGKTPSRANVLAAIRKTDIPASKNPLGQVIKFKADGDLTTSQFYLFKISAGGKYIQIPSH